MRDKLLDLLGGSAYTELMTNTEATIRTKMADLTAGQSSESLLESWITLARQFAHGQTPADERGAVARAMDVIQHTLEARGMTAEQFDTLYWAISSEEQA